MLQGKSKKYLMKKKRAKKRKSILGFFVFLALDFVVFQIYDYSFNRYNL